MTAVEHKSNFRLTKDTPYLILTGELWDVYCEDLEEIHCFITASLYDAINFWTCKKHVTNTVTTVITAIHTHNYCQISNIRCTVVGNIIVDNSDVVGASPVGAAPTTSSLYT